MQWCLTRRRTAPLASVGTINSYQSMELTVEIIIRSEAKSQGLKHYYTGLPCKHGHLSWRRTENGECEECGRIRARKNSLNIDKETKAKRDKKYYANNHKKVRDHQNEKYSTLTKEEKEKHRGINTYEKTQGQKIRSKRFYENNKHRQKELNVKWKSENRNIVYASNQKRRSAKKQAIPKWSDFEKINQIYADSILISEMTSIKHHVDHIVPLNSKIVCGLHCECNLEIITAKSNLEKGNSVWPDMP